MPHIQGDRLGVYIDLPDGKHIHQGHISIQMTHNNDSMPYTRVDVEDLVEILKNYPGLTISYEAPKPKVAETAVVGTVIEWERWNDGPERIVKVDKDRWLIDRAMEPASDDYIQGYLDKPTTKHTVIYPKGV